MFQMSKGAFLEQKKEPALSREIVVFLNSAPSMGGAPAFRGNPSDLSVREIAQLAKDAGIIDERDGQPLYKKILKANKSGVDLLIADAIDDEPFVSSQMGPLLKMPQEAVGALNILGDILGCEHRMIYIYKNLSDLDQRIPKRLEGVPVAGMGGKYPVEHASVLKVAKSDCIIGACALIHLYRALYFSKPQTTTFITVVGNCVANPCNMEVSLGMTVQQVLDRCGLSGNPNRIVVGGPMTGVAILDPDKTLIHAATRAVIAYRDNKKERQYTCIGCARCLDACPVNLNPMYLYKSIAKHKTAQLESLGIRKCIGCGTCSYVCPAKLEISSSIQQYCQRLGPDTEEEAEEAIV